MAPAVPQIAELVAPAGWRTADFISDIHLQAAEPATFDAWRAYMASTPADAVFILGDLFDVWVGDDAAGTGFEAQCADVLQATGQRLALFFMAGNRDFLVGPALMARCGATLLPDPTMLAFAGKRWLLSHGDALCLADTDYMAFRAQVRSSGWQETFLAKPLAERQAIAQGLRQQSREQHARRQQAGESFIDVDAAAAAHWLQAANAPTLIHGHTHQPAVHGLGDGRERIVLSDWDAAATPLRLEVLRLDAQGLHRLPLA
ncbi:MAG: UDP-2,3-diacylglucosamine diphosphatase [Polaromonas sp.]|nr:UDP-2,3-diacylglucosamine diphosphatase [Polaromonas sp.]